LSEEASRKVLCPKEGKPIPVWRCLGSFSRKKDPCPHLEEAIVQPLGVYRIVCSYEGVEEV